MKLQWLKWLHAHSFQLFLVDIYLILWGLFSRAVIIWEWGCSLFLCFLILSFTSVSAVIIWWDLLAPTSNHPLQWQGHSFLSHLLCPFLLPVLVCATVNQEEVTPYICCILGTYRANWQPMAVDLVFTSGAEKLSWFILKITLMRSRITGDRSLGVPVGTVFIRLAEVQRPAYCGGSIP